ncbi:MAG: sigma-54 dependent transcriptional regulator [Acidobacteria bacterium]|nr:sigma-54 dependent transcriptional regulator [Acidobacteriota bacterium]
MGSLRILAVDDEPQVLDLCREVLSQDGYAVETATDTDAALGELRGGDYDLVLTDLRMPGRDGMELIREARRLTPHLPIVVLTGYPSIESAVAAVRQGADDVVTKPFDNEHLCRVVRRALQNSPRDGRKVAAPQLAASSRILGESRATVDLRDLIRRAAATESTVLLQGEIGSGKELAARTLHDASRRQGKPFLALDGTALNTVLGMIGFAGEEEDHDCEGAQSLPANAGAGSLFLDDVDELAPGLQAKLLRFLDHHEAQVAPKQGAGAARPRVIAASREDLQAAVKAGTFREDLYFRLNVIPLRVPSLRERLGDIPVLVQGFLAEFSQLRQEPQKRFSGACLERLASYSWPGNVRELRNVMERMVSLVDGIEVTTTDIPAEILQAVATEKGMPGEARMVFREAKKHAVGQFEREYLHTLLARHDGNVTRSASVAGLNRSAFQRLMRKYGLRSVSYRQAKGEWPS